MSPNGLVVEAIAGADGSLGVVMHLVCDKTSRKTFVVLDRWTEKMADNIRLARLYVGVLTSSEE